MDTAVKYVVVLAAGAGLVYYYTSTDKKGQKTPAVQDVKRETKKAARKVQSYTEKAAKAVPNVSATAAPDAPEDTSQSVPKKRKANPQPAYQAHAAPVAERDDDQGIDQSTRQFAEQMRQVRQGVDVKRTDRGETRVKTIKPKSGQITSPVLSSGSSQAEDEPLSSAGLSPALDSTGIDDMLEKEALGPNSLRITAPLAPVREKANKFKKEEVVETKKQRQNRKKREEKQAAMAEERRQQKVLEEQQRRTARVARNEPARNGTSIPPAPVSNPWSEQNARSEAQVAALSNQNQLLDTFDVDSNSSSNAGEANSTAATSTTDQAPAGPGAEDADYKKIMQESNLEDGWTDVKTSKKSKKQTTNGDATPVPGAANGNSKKQQVTTGGSSSKFSALQDELEDRAETDSQWTV
ncbi:hypothetical protein BST61_g8854 [Cercospora zeina]